MCQHAGSLHCGLQGMDTLGGGELASLLTTYNLSYIINFATRIQNNSSPASDNIFVDKSRINLSSIPPTTNGLSDHNAQILTIKIYMQQ